MIASKDMLYLIKASLLACVLLAGARFAAAQAQPADPGIPHLQKQGNATRLIVDGKPLVLISGELHNSSASSLDYMEPIWPKLASLNLNSVIATISWELVEPEEGKYDFALVDGLIGQARKANMELVFIWFGTWKNANGTYIPAWVKTNPQRFPRCQHVPGRNSTQLSAFCEENLKADARAYAAVMKHIREVDGKEHTVVTMQVENEAGVRPVARDHSPVAEAAFAKAVPEELMKYLAAHKETMLPEIKEIWSKGNFKEAGTWSEVFGKDADEVFMAWHVGRYIGQVAAAGKAEYPIPMYANAWLVQLPGEPAGSYPSGGPVARVHDVWRAAAPAIDLLAPDIYLGTFKEVCAEYTRAGNPFFIPECRNDELAGPRAFYAFSHHHAICFAPFGIDSTNERKTPGKPLELSRENPLGEYYAVLRELEPLIAEHQGKATMNGFLQYKDEERASFDIGDFRAEIEYPKARGNEENKDPRLPGCGIVIATAPDTFIVAGANASIRFGGRPDKPGSTDFLAVEEGTFGEPKGKSYMGSSGNPFKKAAEAKQWIPGRRLNGDEASYRVNLGPRPRILKVKVYRFQ